MTPERRAGSDRRSGIDRRAAATSGDHAAIERITQEIVPALMARLSASSLGELEVRQGAWRVRLRKPPQASPEPASGAARPGRRGVAAGGTGAAASTVRRSVADGDGARAALRAVGPGPSAAPPRGPETRRAAATSPAVGYFAPDERVGVGIAVRAGDTLGHVDVLGVRQEIVAPVDGVVGRYLVEAGQAVEYGQELIRIELAVPAAGAASEGS